MDKAHEWELVSMIFNSTSHLGVSRTSKKVCFPRRWGHQKAGVWYPRDIALAPFAKLRHRQCFLQDNIVDGNNSA